MSPILIYSFRYSASIFLCLTLLGCGESNLAKIELGRSDPAKILSYYFEIFQGSDPFDSGLLTIKDGSYFLDKEKSATLPLLEKLSSALEDDILDWNEFKAFLESNYNEASDAPANISELRNPSSEKYELTLHGVMTEAKRKIKIELSHLQDAIISFEENGKSIIYPNGTTFIADHLDDDQSLIETTVMKKSDYGNWAYWVFDRNGNLASSTTSEPRNLKSPTQCIGCHMGEKRFQPEASFPETLENRERRRRQIYIDQAVRNASPVDLLKEHEKRSDLVLGVYASTYLGALSLKAPDQLTSQEKKVLESISF